MSVPSPDSITKVSVIIPCYNHGHFIKEAIDSISYLSGMLNLEIIIVNDGSTDGYTLEKLKDLENDGFLIVNQNNQGLGPARNNGIAIAKGEYILILDSDNKIANGFVEAAVSILDQQPHIGVVHGDMQYFGKLKDYKKVPDYDKLSILSGNYIDACTLIRAKVFEEVGGYDTERIVGAYTDWELWIRIGKSKWEFYHTQGLSFYYRISENSMIDAVKDDYDKHLSAFKYIVTKHFDSYSYLIHEFGPIRDKMNLLAHENYRLKTVLKNPLSFMRWILNSGK